MDASVEDVLATANRCQITARVLVKLDVKKIKGFQCSCCIKEDYKVNNLPCRSLGHVKVLSPELLESLWVHRRQSGVPSRLWQCKWILEAGLGARVSEFDDVVGETGTE